MKRKNFRMGYIQGDGWFLTCDVGDYCGMYYLHKDGSWAWGTYDNGGEHTGYWRYPSEMVKTFRKEYPMAILKVAGVY